MSVLECWRGVCCQYDIVMGSENVLMELHFYLLLVFGIYERIRWFLVS